MNQRIEISGLDDCLRWMDQAPANCLKASKSAMRTAGKKTASKIRRNIPKRWRSLVKATVDKNRSGNLIAWIGMFNGKQHQGHQNPNYTEPIDDWFKAYWGNYGTLTHRDPNHKFKEPVKRGNERRRNDVGQIRKNFFENALSGWEGDFFNEFSQALAKQEQTFYER